MPKKSKTPSARYMEQAQQAHELVLGGMGYRQIAEEMGVSLGTVQNRLRLYREEVSMPKLEDLRNRQLARIEMGIRALWPRYLNGDKDAINGMVALMKREADLLGLNAATAFKVEVEQVDVNTEFNKMLDKLMGQEGRTEREGNRPRRRTPPKVIQATATTSEPITPPDEFAREPDVNELAEFEIEPEPDPIPAPRPRRRGRPVPNPADQFLTDDDD